jgi:hypothetical protein
MRPFNTLRDRRTWPIVLLIVALLDGFVLPCQPRLAAATTAGRVFAPAIFVPAPAADELVVFDWNGPITIEQHGTPTPEPLPGANGDWTQPINYAGGTIHLRLEVRNQPQPQSMRLQICWWQDGRESCTRAGKIVGQPGAVTTWSQPVARLWSLNDTPIDWSQPRSHGIFVRDADNDIVSDYGDWNWAGHDPADWFPLDVRFTAVVVEAGGTFSGWDQYVP